MLLQALVYDVVCEGRLVKPLCSPMQSSCSPMQPPHSNVEVRRQRVVPRRGRAALAVFATFIFSGLEHMLFFG